jgi:hypothetical protein
MRAILVIILLALNLPAMAHHTKDHTMLLENADDVIAGTRQGVEGGGLWLLWVAVLLFLFLGFVRWWKGRS